MKALKLSILSTALLAAPTLILARGNQPDDQAVTTSSVTVTSTTTTYSTQGASGAGYDENTSTATYQRQGTLGVSGTGKNGPSGPADDY